MSAVNTTRALGRAAVAALVAVTSVLAFQWGTSSDVHGAEPVVTSDIVLVLEDSYGLGDTATLAIRNDGDVPYKYNDVYQQCYFTYKDASGRAFRIPPATHCDIIHFAEIAPGETATLVNSWALDECTLEAFFCMAIRPLPTGAYTISGSLDSVDGTKRAEFSKTISITGPTFTSDITATFGVILTDPPAGVPPVFLTLSNHGSVGYAMPQAQCVLFFRKPDGIHFSIPVAPACEGSPALLAPEGHLDVVTNWRLDECTQFGPAGNCLTSQPLPPGTYTVEGAAWSQDHQSYAEFSASYTITASPTPTSSPNVTPVILPKGGGPAGTSGAARPDSVLLGAALALVGALVLAGAIRTTRKPRSLSAHCQRPGRVRPDHQP